MTRLIGPGRIGIEVLILHVMDTYADESISLLQAAANLVIHPITLRRFRFLLPTAGSLERIIWIPETAEILSQDGRD